MRNSKYSSLKYWNISGKGQNDIGHYGNQSNLPGSVRFTASQATLNAFNASQSNRQPKRLSPGAQSTDLKQSAVSNTGASPSSSSSSRRHAPDNNLVVHSQELKPSKMVIEKDKSGSSYGIRKTNSKLAEYSKEQKQQKDPNRDSQPTWKRARTAAAPGLGLNLARQVTGLRDACKRCAEQDRGVR